MSVSHHWQCSADEFSFHCWQIKKETLNSETDVRNFVRIKFSLLYFEPQISVELECKLFQLFGLEEVASTCGNKGLVSDLEIH